jgi:hypothetical protein
VSTTAGVVAAAALLLSIPLGIAVLALLSVLALAISIVNLPSKEQPCS